MIWFSPKDWRTTGTQVKLCSPHSHNLFYGCIHLFLTYYSSGIENLGTRSARGITGGGLTDRYNFVQLHFHWSKTLFGSEHTIDRKEYVIYFLMLFFDSKST